MSTKGYEQAVLSDALADAIGGRRVRAAVFTTFTFDPGFFELHVLPLLFPGRSFDHRDGARRAQLEDSLQMVNSIAVYYDLKALSQDSTPAQLRFERIGMHRSGCFHPKVSLVLVEDPFEDQEADDPIPLSLVIGIASANLTRSGYWENVEVAHFEELRAEVRDASRSSYRRDLLGLLQALRRNAPPDVEHRALNMVHRFVRDDTVREPMTQRSYGGAYYTRLFYGQDSLAVWIETELAPRGGNWHLEVTSPFFDRGNAGTLERLIDAIDPIDTRVYLPRDPDGTPTVDEETYDAIAAVADWAALPVELTTRAGGAKKMQLAPRSVHAKLYRLWAQGQGEVLIGGSVNLTSPGHSHSGAGNLEAAFVVHRNIERKVGRWLEVDADRPAAFAQQNTDETEGAEEVPIPVTLRFDWVHKALSYHLPSNTEGRLSFHDPGGPKLFEVTAAAASEWHALPDEAAKAIEDLLQRTCFVTVKHESDTWRLLVQEEGLALKPSVLSTLSPEEILTIWSLLSEEQRNAFILDRVAAGDSLDALPLAKRHKYLGGNTMFDRFAGLFHAFACLRKQIDKALAEGRMEQVDLRLFGAHCDSLPTLLARIDEQEDGDPVTAYVTYLCTEQLVQTVRREQTPYWKSRRDMRGHLTRPLKRISEVRKALPIDGSNRDEFLRWYEEMFALEIPMLEDEA